MYEPATYVTTIECYSRLTSHRAGADEEDAGGVGDHLRSVTVRCAFSEQGERKRVRTCHPGEKRQIEE